MENKKDFFELWDRISYYEDCIEMMIMDLKTASGDRAKLLGAALKHARVRLKALYKEAFDEINKKGEG